MEGHFWKTNKTGLNRAIELWHLLQSQDIVAIIAYRWGIGTRAKYSIPILHAVVRRKQHGTAENVATGT